MPARPPVPEFAAAPPPPRDRALDALRATLARSGVAIDQTDVSSCGDHHGVTDCFRCTRATTADPEALDAIAIAFARYPTSVIQEAHLEHVALCTSIGFDHAHVGEPEPDGLASPADHRMMLRVTASTPVVHHELFHLLDAAADEDPAWTELDPPGFSYRDPAPRTATRPAGFVNAYATTNAREDRASVFEYLVGDPEALCRISVEDPIVDAKVAIIRKRTAHLPAPPACLRLVGRMR